MFKICNTIFIPRIDRSGAYSFFPVCLSVCQSVCLSIKTRTFSKKLMVYDGAFMFHMCISCGKNLSLLLRSTSSVQVKVKYQGHIYKKKAWGFVFNKNTLFSRYAFLKNARYCATRNGTLFLSQKYSRSHTHYSWHVVYDFAAQ